MADIETLASDDRSARIILSTAVDPGDPLTGRLIATHGAVRTLLLGIGDDSITGTDKAEVLTFRKRLQPRLDEQIAQRALQNTERLGMRALTPTDHDWPTGLNALGTRTPLALWATGRTELLAGSPRSLVTISGSRAATSYGMHVAGDIAMDLGDSGRVIVAGAAYGIDSAAHRGALARHHPTIAVLATGTDVIHPVGNAELLRNIAENHLILSEQAPGRHATRTQFLARTRILAALSAGTIIVEAGVRSGAMRIAEQARELGRVVGAVPGAVTSSVSYGPHKLLRDNHAILVTSADDLLRVLDVQPESEILRRGVVSRHHERITRPETPTLPSL